MRTLRVAFAAAFAFALTNAAAESKPCPPVAAGQAASRKCPPPPPKFEPYDPDRMRSGSRPGFVDVGNGTEVKVGGRVGVEAGTRR